MEKLKKYILSILLLILLSGCVNVKNSLDSKKTAQDLVIEQLNNKYQETFIKTTPDDNESLTEYPSKVVYIGTFQPIDNEEEKITVWISSRDEMKDNYGQYFVSEEAEKQIKELIPQDNMINQININFEGEGTSEKLNPNITLDEYSKEFHVFYNVGLVFSVGATDEEYAIKIEKILNVLYNHLNEFNFTIKVEDRYLFTTTYKKNNEKLTKTRILDEIDNQRSTNEVLYN